MWRMSNNTIRKIDTGRKRDDAGGRPRQRMGSTDGTGSAARFN